MEERVRGEAGPLVVWDSELVESEREGGEGREGRGGEGRGGEGRGGKGGKDHFNHHCLLATTPSYPSHTHIHTHTHTQHNMSDLYAPNQSCCFCYGMKGWTYLIQE